MNRRSLDLPRDDLKREIERLRLINKRLMEERVDSIVYNALQSQYEYLTTQLALNQITLTQEKQEKEQLVNKLYRVESENSIYKETLEEVEIASDEKLSTFAKICRDRACRINELDYKLKDIEAELEKIDRLCKVCSSGVANIKCNACVGELCKECKNKTKQCPFCRAEETR
jgi:hypothetical protein